jgi:hypothetical protein
MIAGESALSEVPGASDFVDGRTEAVGFDVAADGDRTTAPSGVGTRRYTTVSTTENRSWW